MADLKAQQLRTIWIALDDKLNVLTALQKLQNNQGLSAGESGTIAYEAIANATLLGEPVVMFDGFLWNVVVFVTSA